MLSLSLPQQRQTQGDFIANMQLHLGHGLQRNGGEKNAGKASLWECERFKDSAQLKRDDLLHYIAHSSKKRGIVQHLHTQHVTSPLHSINFHNAAATNKSHNDTHRDIQTKQNAKF